MAKITKKLAVTLSTRIPTGAGPDEIRDAVDQMTDGDLDAWQLDTLTDWVVALTVSV